MQTPLTQNQPFTASDIYKPVLKVMGLGGGGSNAVQRMIELDLKGVEFIAANTDSQALAKNPAPVKIQLGSKATRGLGAGGNYQVGAQAAEESSAEIMASLRGADMVFLTAGMGGGTGTGSISVAARIARSLGAVTIAIVTTPFTFEMGQRQKNAREGLSILRQHTNTLIAIPNDRLLYVAPRNLPMEIAFRMADDVLRQSVQGISELITEPGLINVDFAHIRRLVQLGGGAMMTIGQASGDGKARKAVEQALHHPLLEAVSLDNAAGIIANFTGGNDLTLLEVQDAVAMLQAQTGADTEIVLGVNNDERMNGRSQVILVITGLGATTLEEALSGIQRPRPETVRELTRENAFPTLNPATQRGIPAISNAEPQAPSIPATTPLRQYPDGIINTQNMDIPAFLRRRIRLAGAGS
jgi:cell division protein FtsZ